MKRSLPARSHFSATDIPNQMSASSPFPIRIRRAAFTARNFAAARTCNAPAISASSKSSAKIRRRRRAPHRSHHRRPARWSIISIRPQSLRAAGRSAQCRRRRHRLATVENLIAHRQATREATGSAETQGRAEPARRTARAGPATSKAYSSSPAKWKTWTATACASWSTRLRQKLGSGVIALGMPDDGKVALIVAVTKDLTPKVHAGKLIQALAKQVGGSGGGRPDLAEAGGKDTAALKSALESIPASWSLCYNCAAPEVRDLSKVAVSVFVPADRSPMT